MKITKTDTLKTWDLGKYEGTPQTKEAVKEIDTQLINQPDKPISTGESFVQFSNRILGKIKELLESSPANTIALTHNSAFGLIKLWDKRGRPKNLDRPFRTEYTKQDSTTGDFFALKSKAGTVYVVRHGETEDNKKGNFRADTTDLTKKGMEQAKATGQELKGKDIKEIITSSLPRAVETSNIIANVLDDVKDEEPEEDKVGEPKEDEKIEDKTPEENKDLICKSTFLYMEPKGDKHKFAQCGSCWKFTGKSCLEFSPNDRVDAEDSCGLYNFGEPQPDHVGKEHGGTTPKAAGFVNSEVRCENCEYFEEGDNDCLLFRMLNIKDYKVDKHGCCNAFSRKGED